MNISEGVEEANKDSVETESYVALAGPLVGTICALGVYLWARSEGSGLLLAISYSGFFLNLFNLLPLSPLDGGRITAVLSPRIWFLGVPILLAAMLYRPSPMLIFIAVLAAPQLMKAWRYDPKAPENAATCPFRPSSNTAPRISRWQRCSRS
jgi:Zn-dependent protease